MNTFKLNLFLSLFMAVFSVQSMQAQWTDMEWNSFNLKFKYPTNFTIKQNDSATFTASGKIFTMTIDAWEDYDYSSVEDICNDVVNTIDCTGKILVEESEIKNKGNLEGYKRYYTAYQNGKLMHMIVAAFIDDLFLYDYSVKILYWDDPKQNDIDYKAAQYIIDNIVPMDE